MLSILIPVYNHNVFPLAESLCKQTHSDEIEILVVDDASSDKAVKEINRKIVSFPNLCYMEAEHNMGRSKIRNFLFRRSHGEILVFLDCDSKITDDNFVEKYLSLSKDFDLVCGGTTYCPSSEVSSEYILHLTCGKQREQGRNHFTANNFMIKRKLFSEVLFDETIKGYGHEDTLFFLSLKNHFPDLQIAYDLNTVEHTGLKKNVDFLTDISNASRNLALLYRQENLRKNLSSLPIVKAGLLLKNYHLEGFYLSFVKFLRPCLIKQLKSSRPCLKFLDLLKLQVFIGTCKDTTNQQV